LNQDLTAEMEETRNEIKETIASALEKQNRAILEKFEELQQ